MLKMREVELLTGTWVRVKHMIAQLESWDAFGSPVYSAYRALVKSSSKLA